MSATAQHLALADLLARTGARIRGRGRADCPKCKRQRSVSFEESRGVYHCHGQGCDFSGGAVKLARELGLARQLSGAEYRELRQNHELADRAARVLYKRVRARRFELLQELRELGRLELEAHEAGLGHAATWDTLALVYPERPALLAELTILEERSAADLIRFLTADAATRVQIVSEVVFAGGLHDGRGRFLELAL